MNVVAIYGGEIQPFTENYDYDITSQTIASMLNCVAGIAASIYLGKILDKKRTFKLMQIVVGGSIAFSILLTFIGLQFEWPRLIVLTIIVLAGGPISSVSVVSY